MTGPGQKKSIRTFNKVMFIFAYGSVMFFYGVLGGVLLNILFPNISFFIFMVLSVFIGGKLDYKFGGPAYKFEQKFVSQTGNKNAD